MMPRVLLQEKGPYGSIIIACPAEAGQLVTYQMELLVRHRPDWLLPGYLRYRAGKPQVCLETTGLRPLDEAYAEADRSQELGRQLLCMIGRYLLEGDDRLLPPGQFSLHPSLIFLDPEKNIRLAFWPYREEVGCSGQDHRELSELVRLTGCAFSWPDAQIEAAVCAARTGPAALVGHLTEPADQKPGTADPDEPAITKETAAAGDTDRQAVASQSRSRPKWLLPLLSAAVHAGLAVWAGAVFLGQFRETASYLLPALSGLALCDALLTFRHSRCRSASAEQDGSRPERTGRQNWLFRDTGRTEDNPGAMTDQTILLAGAEPDFRMAMLSEGEPGTAAEHEGLRSFILVDEFLIGRDPKKVDLCLPDNSVGRMHARISRRAGSFFVCDLGSGNGTRMDGKRLPKHMESLLPDRCLLQFADRIFHFQAD